MSVPGKMILVSVAMTLSLFGLAACGEDGKKADDTSKEQASDKPDLAGIPKVVAVVNDRKIDKNEFVTAYKSQFQQQSMQAQTSGQPVDQNQLKKQTIEGLVGNDLLLQEAERRDFTASTKDVEATLEQYAQQSGAKSTKEYLSTMKKQGLEEKAVRTQLKAQVMLDQLLTEEVGDSKTSEKELRQLYDQAVAQQKQSKGQAQGQPQQEIPPFEEARPQLEEQAKSQKQGEAAQTLVKDLRKDAKVKINL